MSEVTASALSGPVMITGLGNPGKDYEATRHNIGFMAVERIANDYHFGAAKTKFHAFTQDGTIAGTTCRLVCPQTFMNRSGISVGEASRFYKIPPEHIIVLHDELDLPLGTIKVKKGGGSAGHNGIKDIDRVIGKEYWRVRLGIKHPGLRESVTGHVLGRFSGDEWDAVEDMLGRVSTHIRDFVNHSPQKMQEMLHASNPKA